MPCFLQRREYIASWFFLRFLYVSSTSCRIAPFWWLWLMHTCLLVACWYFILFFHFTARPYTYMLLICHFLVRVINSCATRCCYCFYLLFFIFKRRMLYLHDSYETSKIPSHLTPLCLSPFFHNAFW